MIARIAVEGQSDLGNRALSCFGCYNGRGGVNIYIPDIHGLIAVGKSAHKQPYQALAKEDIESGTYLVENRAVEIGLGAEKLKTKGQLFFEEPRFLKV